MSLSRTIAQSIYKHEIPADRVADVLETHGLIALLPAVKEEMERLTSSHKGGDIIKIETPFPLSEEAQMRIKRIVGNDLAPAQTSINPDLLAGFKARWKGKLYDASAERIIKELIRN